MRIRRYTKNRRGAGIVEYGLIVGLIAVGAVVAVQNSGDRVSGLLDTVAAELSGVSNSMVSGTHASNTAESDASPASPVVGGVLTIGNTTKIVERDGVEARCALWGDNKCLRPQMRPVSTSCNEYGYPTEWHDVLNHPTSGSGRRLRAEGWCEIATGEIAADADLSGYSPSPNAWAVPDSGGTLCDQDDATVGTIRFRHRNYDGNEGMEILCSGFEQP